MAVLYLKYYNAPAPLLLSKELCPLNHAWRYVFCSNVHFDTQFATPPPVTLVCDTKTPMKATASRLIKLYTGTGMNYAAALMSFNQ